MKMKKMKHLFIRLIQNSHVQLLIVIICTCVAVYCGFSSFNRFKPDNFTKEEIYYLTETAKEVYQDDLSTSNNNLNYIYSHFEDVDISVISETEIKIAVDHGNKWVIADFTEPDSPIVSDNYSLVIPFIIGILLAIVEGLAGFIISSIGVGYLDYKYSKDD